MRPMSLQDMNSDLFSACLLHSIYCNVNLIGAAIIKVDRIDNQGAVSLAHLHQVYRCPFIRFTHGQIPSVIQTDYWGECISAVGLHAPLQFNLVTPAGIIHFKNTRDQQLLSLASDQMMVVQ